MSALLEALESVRAEGVREERRKHTKNVTKSGKVLSLMRANGEWMAVVASATSERDLPVLSKVVPVTELTGSARRKADRWVEWLK